METEGLASKLASYSALAASVVSFAPDMNAQCVPAGGSLPIDIDGDGVTDITVSHTTSTVFTSTGTNSVYVAASTFSSGPYTIVLPGPAYTSAGCGPLVGGPWTLNLSTVFANYQYVYNVQVSFTYIAYNLNYVSAGANQLVGLTVGSDVCAGISTGGAASAFAGFDYYAAFGSVVNVFTSYYYAFANFVAASASSPIVSNPANCTEVGLPIATFTYYIGAFSAGPYYGFSQIAGPSSNVATVTGGAALPAIGVQFQSPTNGGTMNGWAQLSLGADGLLCVDATGFNGCSVEEVAAAGAAAGTECIAVGDATSNTSNEACAVLVPTCTLTGINPSVSACDDAGTTAPDNSADGDDTAIITIDPAGDLDDGAGNITPLAGSYTVTGLPTATTGTFGTPLTETVPADGATYTVTITYTDAADPTITCTMMTDIVAPAACSLEPPTTDIPTLSEWGLITLALLLMSYGSLAMVGTAGLAGSTRSQTFNFGSKMFNIPFDNRVYRKALMLTGLIAAAGFTGCFAMYGAIFMSDIIGTAIAGPVFAYLAHLLYLLETRREKK